MIDQIVTLLRPPIISSCSSFSVPVTPPLALAYLTATLERAGYSVDPIDALGEKITHIEKLARGRKAQGLLLAEMIRRINPRTDILGVSIMFTQEWPVIRDLMAEIKKAHPHITIIAGGEHITALPEFSMEDCAALGYCALGEGEETLRDFVGAVRSGQDPRQVPGLCYRNGEGFEKSPKRKRIANLAEIPWPAWDKLPIEAYLASGYGNGVNNGRNMPMLATRGCPYQCTFCSNPVMYERKYVMRAVDDVIAEMMHYIKHRRAEFIEFYDLTAIVQKKWIVEFCDKYLENGLTVGWSLPSGTRSEALDGEVLALLHRTNCRYLVYAPESGSPITLKQIKKEVRLDRLLASVRTAVRLGINTRCNLIIGFPKETTREVFKTLVFQVKLAWLGVDDAPIYMFSPYPGSTLFDDLKGTGQIPALNDDYFDGLLAQMDLGVDKTYCKNINGSTLRRYRLVGMSVFYGLSYLFRPFRIIRSINNIFFRKKTSSVFEQRVLEMFKRRKEIA